MAVAVAVAAGHAGVLGMLTRQAEGAVMLATATLGLGQLVVFLMHRMTLPAEMPPMVEAVAMLKL